MLDELEKSYGDFLVGQGYIILPVDIQDFSREKYIRSCFENNTVSIRTLSGFVYHHVKVSRSLFNYISFPEDNFNIGSLVLYVTSQINGEVFIVSSYGDPYSTSSIVSNENQFVMQRLLQGKLVSITGDVNSNTLLFNISSKTQPGKLILNVLSDNKDSEFVLEVTGKCNIVVTDSITNTSLNSIITQVLDVEEQDTIKSSQTILKDSIESKIEEKDVLSTIKQTKDRVEVVSEKIVLGEEKEPMVLGDTLISFFEDFIDEISRTTVSTSLGIQPILNKVQILNLKQKLKELLSNTNFLK